MLSPHTPIAWERRWPPEPEQWYKLPAVARYYLLLETFVMIQTLVAQGIVQRMVLTDDGIYRLKAASGF